MFHDLTLADALFILLICLLIWGIMATIGFFRRKRAERPGENEQSA